VTKKTYRIVPTDPKTGKLITSPKSRQLIKFALIGPRGGIKRISDAPIQPFTKKDFLGLNRTIASGKNYIIYEQLTNRYARDKNGKPIPRKDKDGKILLSPVTKKPVYFLEKKFTFFNKKAEQRPVLYAGTKRQRELDIGFKKLSPRQQADQKAAVFVKPDTGIKLTYTLTGNSVRDALSNLILDIDKRKIYGTKGNKVAGLYYNIVTYITSPDGKTIRIPASGSIATMEKFRAIFPDLMLKFSPGEQPAIAKEVKTLANINREIAFVVSNSMSTMGYSFTAPHDLDTYSQEMLANQNKMRSEAMLAKELGQIKLAEKKMKSVKRIDEARRNMLKQKKGKIYLDPGQYTVKIVIDFETIPQ
jgi:hypothetical protein